MKKHKRVLDAVRRVVKKAAKKVPKEVRRGAVIGSVVPVPGATAVGAGVGGAVILKRAVERVVRERTGRPYRMFDSGGRVMDLQPKDVKQLKRDKIEKTRDVVDIGSKAVTAGAAVTAGLAVRKVARNANTEIGRVSREVRNAAKRTDASSVVGEVSKRGKKHVKKAFPTVTKVARALLKKRKFKIPGVRGLEAHEFVRVPQVIEDPNMAASLAGYFAKEGLNKGNPSISKRGLKNGVVVTGGKKALPVEVVGSGYPNEKSLKKAMRRHEVVHSIQANKRGGKVHRRIRGLLKDEVGAYKVMDRRVKGGSKILRRMNKASGVVESTRMGTAGNPYLRKRAARYGAAAAGVGAAALVAKRIFKNREKRELDSHEFAGRDQLKEKGSNKYVNPLQVASGQRTGYYVSDSKRKAADLPINHGQVIRAAYNKGKKVERVGGRAVRLARDAKDVVTRKDRRKDAAGRKKKREWEKSWFRKAASSAGVGAGVLGYAALLKKNPQIRSKRSGVNKVLKKVVGRNHNRHVRTVHTETVRKAKAAVNKRIPDAFSGFQSVQRIQVLDALIDDHLIGFDGEARGAGWDVRDPRGRSARVFAPGSKRRERRDKRWHEKADNERKLWKAGIVGALLAGTALRPGSRGIKKGVAVVRAKRAARLSKRAARLSKTAAGKVVTFPAKEG